MLLHSCSLQSDMQHDHVLKKSNLDQLTPSKWLEGWERGHLGVGGLQVNIWYCVAAIVNLLNLICSVTIF